MYKNMKIAITDEVHLKAVCEVLESMSYKSTGYENDEQNFVYTYERGVYHGLFKKAAHGEFEEVTLTDLLRMRDEMVKGDAHG